MRIINIIDNVDPLNIGLWNSVTINNKELRNHGVCSELWFPRAEFNGELMFPVPLNSIGANELKEKVVERKLNPSSDIIVTHGVWNYPSRWGKILQAAGYRWICVPHGMLEPWPLKQKRLKKKIYFGLIEKQNISKANIIRAVSRPERVNLKKKLPGSRIEFIPNGVEMPPASHNPHTHEIKTYLFLSRLHHKKNVIALAEAWVRSTLNNDPAFELLIAGPDQGELEGLKGFIAKSSNLRYLGAVFGEEKESLFRRSDFFVLPSFSEGLPSSLLEAMAHGLVPIVTNECNFPDVSEKDLGKIITTDYENIRTALQETSCWSREILHQKSNKSKELIFSEYSIQAVTKTMLKIYFEGML